MLDQPTRVARSVSHTSTVARTRITFISGFTRRFGNPITRLVAGHLPWFCILRYRGRKSGKAYRTPMNVFRKGGAWIFALTYGSDVQWVKNVLAAGGCEIETRGRVVALDRPGLFIDPRRRAVPRIVAFFLGFIGVTEFLRMHPAGASSPPMPPPVRPDEGIRR
jgi:deazaflavin-dependent oxidoreductase (nitroreductase family)